MTASIGSGGAIVDYDELSEWFDTVDKQRLEHAAMRAHFESGESVRVCGVECRPAVVTDGGMAWRGRLTFAQLRVLYVDRAVGGPWQITLSDSLGASWTAFGKSLKDAERHLALQVSSTCRGLRQIVDFAAEVA